MEEEWVDVPDYPDYAVSSLGRVFSKSRQRYLKVSFGTKKYPRVNLVKNKQWRIKFVHTLVAQSFVPGYFAGAVVRHKDGDVLNNAATNLEWVTRSSIHRPLRRWQVINDEGDTIEVPRGD